MSLVVLRRRFITSMPDCVMSEKVFSIVKTIWAIQDLRRQQQLHGFEIFTIYLYQLAHLLQIKKHFLLNSKHTCSLLK